MKKFGLIGKKLTHSFSKEYFNKKFKKSNLENYQYNNYEIKNLDEIEQLLKTEKLCGLNVTIPYKQEIINYLDNIEITAKEIGSVNTLKIKEKKIFGYNTDILGFEKSILPLIGNRKSALILGNGGASQTVQFIFKKHNIKCTVVSRNGEKNYTNLTFKDIVNNLIIINTTPLGMYPNNLLPNIPYDHLNNNQIHHFHLNLSNPIYYYFQMVHLHPKHHHHYQKNYHLNPASHLLMDLCSYCLH